MTASDMEATRTVAELKLLEQNEQVASFFNMKLEELTPGYARVTLKLKPEYQNFNGFVMGGIIMTVADQAFAYASNSLSYPSVASQVNIHFVNGAGVDDELTAECRVVRSGRRVGISQMTVKNQEDKLIATATGTTIPINSK